MTETITPAARRGAVTKAPVPGKRIEFEVTSVGLTAQEQTLVVSAVREALSQTAAYAFTDRVAFTLSVTHQDPR